ncbi:MAG: NTP transferase domain-containing protein [Caldilineaceae bacterium]
MSYNAEGFTSHTMPTNGSGPLAPEKVIGLVPAAGMARRLAIETPKELIMVNNKAVIEYSIDHLIAANVDEVIVIIRVGKEAIKTHLVQKYPHLTLRFVYQSGSIGNLIDAIQAAYQAIRGHTVYFCMADVMMSPNPFLFSRTPGSQSSVNGWPTGSGGIWV